MMTKPNLSFWKLWNLSFGFLRSSERQHLPNLCNVGC